MGTGQCSLHLREEQHWLLLGSPVQAEQAYWEGSAELVRNPREGSLGEEEDAVWSRLCSCGQEVGEPGTLDFIKDKVPGQQEHGKG